MSSKDLFPQHKHDHERVEQLKRLSKDDLREVIPDLMIWLQDGNWPISPEVKDILLPFEDELIPHIRTVLKTDDGQWKWMMLVCLVQELPKSVLKQLKQDLIQLVEQPSLIDKEDEVDEIASKILKTI